MTIEAPKEKKKPVSKERTSKQPAYIKKLQRDLAVLVGLRSQ